LDLNQRPPGYEPDELPGCSTPRIHITQVAALVQPHLRQGRQGVRCVRTSGAPVSAQNSGTLTLKLFHVFSQYARVDIGIGN
jgi:hypothetical protein